MSIDDVLSLIVALSPADRRRLFRRAQRMALLDVRDLVPDPSSTTTAREQEAATPSSPRGDKTVPAVQPPRTPAATTARLIEPKPATTTVKPPPSRQPGRAPAVAGSSGEARVRVVFDGGSKGNPGAGYGSYALQWPGQAQPEIVRLEFSGRMTNNEAEYDTLTCPRRRSTSTSGVTANWSSTRSTAAGRSTSRIS